MDLYDETSSGEEQRESKCTAKQLKRIGIFAFIISVGCFIVGLTSSSRKQNLQVDSALTEKTQVLMETGRFLDVLTEWDEALQHTLEMVTNVSTNMGKAKLYAARVKPEFEKMRDQLKYNLPLVEDMLDKCGRKWAVVESDLSQLHGSAKHWCGGQKHVLDEQELALHAALGKTQKKSQNSKEQFRNLKTMVDFNVEKLKSFGETVGEIPSNMKNLLAKTSRLKQLIGSPEQKQGHIDDDDDDVGRRLSDGLVNHRTNHGLVNHGKVLINSSQNGLHSPTKAPPPATAPPATAPLPATAPKTTLLGADLVDDDLARRLGLDVSKHLMPFVDSAKKGYEGAKSLLSTGAKTTTTMTTTIPLEVYTNLGKSSRVLNENLVQLDGQLNGVVTNIHQTATKFMQMQGVLQNKKPSKLASTNDNLEKSLARLKEIKQKMKEKCKF